MPRAFASAFSVACTSFYRDGQGTALPALHHYDISVPLTIYLDLSRDNLQLCHSHRQHPSQIRQGQRNAALSWRVISPRDVQEEVIERARKAKAAK